MNTQKLLNRAFYLYRTYQLNNIGRREYAQIATHFGYTPSQLNARMNDRLNARWRAV